MKKLIALLLTICLSFCCLFALSSCESTGSQDHSFDEEWSYDEDFHWHACKDEGCNQKNDKAEHAFDVVEKDGKYYNVCVTCLAEFEIPDVAEHEHVKSDEVSFNNNFHWHSCTFEGCPYRFDNAEHYFLAPEIVQTTDKITRTYTCEHCGYSYVVETTINSIVSGEKDWTDAFDNLEYVNYSLTVYFFGTTEQGLVLNDFNTLHFTETACHVFSKNGNSYYSVKNEDGSFTTYENYDGDDSPYIISDDTSDSYYTGIKNESILDISFADYYESFSYDEELGAYVSEGPIEATFFKPNGEALGTLICTNIVVKIADGKITSISANYTFSDEYVSSIAYKFEYYNIGITEVVVPQSVIDNAITEQPDQNESSSDEWIAEY